MAAPESSHLWGLDVSSFMVLIGENEEPSYRLSQRCLLQCVSGVPVAGLQNYIRSYDLLHGPGTSVYSYFSPYGCKSAPLRNILVTNAIKHAKLLEDERYTVFQIPSSTTTTPKPHVWKYRVLLFVWIALTWFLFAVIVVFSLLTPYTTWIGLANCVVLTGWSVLIRVVEYFNIRPAPIWEGNVNNPDGPDAVFIMGRSNSAVVLEGSRRDVKRWTSPELRYAARPLGIPAAAWQWFTRVGSALVLAFIFSSIPNGSTTDQVAFIMLNVLGQVNVVVGQGLNSRWRLSELVMAEETREATRTHVYARLLRRFKQVDEETGWVEVSGILPKTEVWEEWKREVVVQENVGPKKLYICIDEKVKEPRLEKNGFAC
ncbi:hypothetical protein MFIFM68171_04918 [Madurella fahalii]|uniref:Uncharacterized protein n=1 Tax=Madurella fahalii TaxID=1157608 RepID=A0ABQ0GAB8_9PEZI